MNRNGRRIWRAAAAFSIETISSTHYQQLPFFYARVQFCSAHAPHTNYFSSDEKKTL
jgi:hypothetical protein